jgi:hypothetical protein
MVWGRLEQSEYARADNQWPRRFMAGGVGVFLPKGVEGLEIGAARFFHMGWPEEGLGLSEFLKPLESIVKVGLSETGIGPDGRSSPDNQLASVFARWVLPSNGFEVYGEYGREDHNWDFRDLALQPDHSTAFMLGLTKVWRLTGQRVASASIEHMNARVSHLVNVRLQGPFYIHGDLHQGHTQRGQLLGSPSAYSGAGTEVEVAIHHSRGKSAVRGLHTLVRDRREIRTSWENLPIGDEADAGLAVESQLFLRRFDLTGSVTTMRRINRSDGPDVWNLSARLAARWIPATAGRMRSLRGLVK